MKEVEFVSSSSVKGKVRPVSQGPFSICTNNFSGYLSFKSIFLTVYVGDGSNEDKKKTATQVVKKKPPLPKKPEFELLKAHLKMKHSTGPIFPLNENDEPKVSEIIKILKTKERSIAAIPEALKEDEGTYKDRSNSAGEASIQGR